MSLSRAAATSALVRNLDAAAMRLTYLTPESLRE
jgi:hypothetical protein